MQANKPKRFTIVELIKNFRDSLISLTPYLDKLGIEWGKSGEFDEFDGIAESLFMWMVINSIQNQVDNDKGFVPAFPNYGYFYKDYSKLSFIEVVGETEDSDSYLALVYLSTNANPFDSVFCNKIDLDGKIIEEGISLDITKVYFRCLLRDPEGESLYL